MAYDIHGNILRRGHCEIHPHVAEEYPCSLCYEQDRKWKNYKEQEKEYYKAMNSAFENKKPVTIVCSAIWYQDFQTMTYLPENCDKGVVLCGIRHTQIIQQLAALTGKRTVTHAPDGVGNFKQGFLTSENRFVERKEAAIIAYRSGQIETDKAELFSEDIW